MPAVDTHCHLNLVEKMGIPPALALENAASVSGLLLMTEALITDKPEKEAPMPPMPGGGMPGGMGGMY